MKAESDKICGSCMGLITNISTGDFRHTKELDWHQNTKALIESKKTCQICATVWDFFLGPNRDAVVERFEDVNHQDNFPVSLRLSDAKSTGETPGLTWATLDTTLEVKQRAFQYLADGNIGVSIETSEDQPSKPFHHSNHAEIDNGQPLIQND
ncbi:uncharacterized protein CTRU02_205089 [Colletotrichum truncatum]|uniref:Uncharacterized protein n=1 Tax=Colletotrichum truncatum TaxID=5467 RepID=A0ACC3Z310_COLTU|nr:uncharacterized protein CTRU02_06080 [Colletotrichum truncatum]KAF6793208.1 hypothetical protein CTRU02_06080 [Colletotrichum truncatum]